MNGKQEVASSGHLQVVGERGRRRWRAFWWDADGKHSRVLGPAWVQSSGKRTARGAVVWHAGDGPKPDASYLTPREAERALRRLLEHEAVRQPSARNPLGAPVTFADAAAAWLEHGEKRRNLKRSTIRDYRQVIDAYLVAPRDGERESSETDYGYAPFADRALRELRASDIKGWYDKLPFGRTSEKLLMVVRAILAHAGRAAGSKPTPRRGSSASRSATAATMTSTVDRRSTRSSATPPARRTRRSI